MVREASDAGIVDYQGYQMDVKPFLAAASAVVLPSYHEGLSNVLLEAAASARPILTTNVPGCAETFEEGVTGFGFAPTPASLRIPTSLKRSHCDASTASTTKSDEPKSAGGIGVGAYGLSSVKSPRFQTRTFIAVEVLLS